VAEADVTDADVAETVDPRRSIVARARELGFDAVGIAAADIELEDDHRRYETFVARGMHGSMQYLARHGDVRRRLDTEHILPGARSIICLGARYARGAGQEATDPPLARRLARYGRGRDYHNFLRRRLRRLAAFVRESFPGEEARPLLDIEPVLERAWAARSGLGFVGKNGLIITPGQGSYQLLGEVVTTLHLRVDEPLAQRCGACTLCLDACPTDAFDAPFVLDPRKCISYLTIERREPAPLPFRAQLGEHLFGCDVCQEVCPFNRTAPPAASQTEPFAPLESWTATGLADCVGASEEEFRRMTQGSPLKRPGRSAVAGNAAIVAHHALERPDLSDAERSDCALALERAREHEDPAVREVAAWASGQAKERTP